MSFGLWTSYDGGAAVNLAHIQVDNALVGSGSLYMETGNQAATGAVNMHLTDAASRGWLKGRIRTIVQFGQGGWPANFFNTNAGIIIMQAELNATTGSTNDYYTLGLGSTSTAAAFFTLKKYTNTHLATTIGGTTLFTEALGTITTDDFWPIELEWDAETSGTGCHLIARLGTKNSTDFGTLVDKHDALDDPGHTVTVGEGVFARKGDTDAQLRKWQLDATGMFVIE
jgi:hypothetical protein